MDVCLNQQSKYSKTFREMHFRKWSLCAGRIHTICNQTNLSISKHPSDIRNSRVLLNDCIDCKKIQQGCYHGNRTMLSVPTYSDMCSLTQANVPHRLRCAFTFWEGCLCCTHALSDTVILMISTMIYNPAKFKSHHKLMSVFRIFDYVVSSHLIKSSKILPSKCIYICIISCSFQ